MDPELKNESNGQMTAKIEQNYKNEMTKSDETTTDLASDSSDAEGTVQESTPEEHREKFLKYWKCASNAFGVTYDGMMLKKNAGRDGFVEADKNEVISTLTSNVDHTFEEILELGAGSGRLTGTLKSICKRIVAIDFLPEYIQKNKVDNYDPINRPHDEFLCADALKLSYPNESFEVVFSNWLLMYFSDAETYEFVKNAAKWVKVGGYMYFRESCGEPSDKNPHRPWAEDGNPTEYRMGQFYTSIFEKELNSYGEFNIIFKEKPVNIYQTKGGTSSQLMWLIHKVG